MIRNKSQIATISEFAVNNFDRNDGFIKLCSYAVHVLTSCSRLQFKILPSVWSRFEMLRTRIFSNALFNSLGNNVEL